MVRNDGVSDDEVAQIRAYLALGYGHTGIANATGRATSTISDIAQDRHRFNTQERESVRCKAARLEHAAWDAASRIAKRPKQSAASWWR